MSIYNIETVDNFTNFIKWSQLTVIHFYTNWAEQCPQITSVLEELAMLPDLKSYGCKFGACDAENLSDISLEYKVDSVPTVIFFKNGTQVDRVDGADVSQITSKVKELCFGKPAAATMSKPLVEKIKALINRHNVMIFMKGNRETPRCGFSKTIIQIIDETGVPYDTFDILTDEEVRQGLKEYSDWPTYPQLYVKGELIGGLDIIKEMQESGELQSTLKA